MAYACFCYLSFSQHPCRFEITGTPNPARDEIVRHFSLPRRATSATSGMHDQSYLCLQQRCANCITQDFLLRPRRSYFWKWSQGQHKCHHSCVWTTKMGKEKTTVQPRNTRSQTNTELPAFFHFNTSDLLTEPHLAKDDSVTAQVLHKIGSKSCADVEVLKAAGKLIKCR